MCRSCRKTLHRFGLEANIRRTDVRGCEAWYADGKCGSRKWMAGGSLPEKGEVIAKISRFFPRFTLTRHKR